MIRIILVLMFMILFCTSHTVLGQIEMDSARYRITTIDGNKYEGKIIHQDTESLFFEAENIGNITIIKKNILRLEQITASSASAFKSEEWGYYVQSNRYFVSSNGYGLKKGEGYYQNIWVLVSQINYGVSDNFSIGGGMVPLFLFAGAPTPVWVNPRFTIPVSKNRFNVGIGGLLGTVVGEGDATYGLINGVATVGSRDKNLSLGLAYGIADGELTTVPLITIGGMIRLGERGYVIMENMFVPDEKGAVVALGGRHLIKRVGLDFGGILWLGDLIDSGRPFILPWLGLNIPLGK